MKVKLDAKEQLSLLCGGVAFVLVLFMLVYIPIGPKKDYLRSAANAETSYNNLVQTRLNKIQAVQRQKSMEKFKGILRKRDPRFDLFAFVGRQLSEKELMGRAKLDEVPVSKRAPANRPEVRLALRGVDMAELIDFLHGVYASQNLIVVNKMTVYATPNNKGLNCDLTLLTIKSSV